MALRPPRQRLPLPVERRCSRCREKKLLTLENFTSEKRNIDTGEIVKFSRWCKSCKAEVARERHASRTAEEIERDRAYNRAAYELRRLNPIAREKEKAAKVRWRQANREKLAAASRRYLAKLKADPERHTEQLVKQRIDYRLGQEAQGREPCRRSKTPYDGWHPTNGHAPLDIEPLAVWLETLFAQDGRDRGEIAHLMRVDERVLWRIRAREHKHVSLAVADHLVWGYGRPVVVRSEFIKTKLVEWAQSLPGNGTRLLRYLDRAEKVAHLADQVVSHVEDLYPELDEVGA